MWMFLDCHLLPNSDPCICCKIGIFFVIVRYERYIFNMTWELQFMQWLLWCLCNQFLHQCRITCSGIARRPPGVVLEQLKQLNQTLNIGSMLCRSRKPDFLLDVIRRQVALQQQQAIILRTQPLPLFSWYTIVYYKFTFGCEWSFWYNVSF